MKFETLLLKSFLWTVMGGLWTIGCAHYEPKPISVTTVASAFETRRLDDSGLRAFVQSAAPGLGTNWPALAWNFDTLTLAALYYHPSLEVARAQWGITTAGVKTAGGRPNPILSVTPGYSANPAEGVSPWFPIGTLDVPIETAHKRQYRLNHASALTEVARLNIYSIAWQVRSALRTALIEHNYAEHHLELLEEQVRTQQELLKLLDQRLAAGTIAAPDIAPARVILLKNLADLAAARSRLAATTNSIGSALGLPAQALEGVTIDTESIGASVINAAEPFTTFSARDTALRTRPDVLSGLAEYAAAETALQLEIAKQYPDVHLSPGYQFDQGEHKWSIGLSIELPVLNRNQGPIAEATAKRSEVAARFLALQARVIGELDLALQVYAATREQVLNAEQLVATAQKQASAIAAALQAGGADQFEAVSARLETMVAVAALADAKFKLQQAVGQLEDSFQIPFNGLNAVEKANQL